MLVGCVLRGPSEARSNVMGSRSGKRREKMPCPPLSCVGHNASCLHGQDGEHDRISGVIVCWGCAVLHAWPKRGQEDVSIVLLRSRVEQGRKEVRCHAFLPLTPPSPPPPPPLRHVSAITPLVYTVSPESVMASWVCVAWPKRGQEEV